MTRVDFPKCFRYIPVSGTRINVIVSDRNERESSELFRIPLLSHSVMREQGPSQKRGNLFGNVSDISAQSDDQLAESNIQDGPCRACQS